MKFVQEYKFYKTEFFESQSITAKNFWRVRNQYGFLKSVSSRTLYPEFSLLHNFQHCFETMVE